MAWTAWRAGLCIALISGAGLSGCASSEEKLHDAQVNYQTGQYDDAYDSAATLADRRGVVADEAAYLAGMSRYQMGQRDKALPYLERASLSTDVELAGQAMAQMGIIYAEQNRHREAVPLLLRAAERLHGQDRAQAYYQAALSEQKLGYLASARTHFTLAGGNSSNPAFKSQVGAVLQTTGYTVQTGAFANAENAQRAAAELARSVKSDRWGKPRLVSSTTAGRSLTLVQIGTFSNAQDAQAARQQMNLTQAVVVPIAR